jgi:hypothetical protein
MDLSLIVAGVSEALANLIVQRTDDGAGYQRQTLDIQNCMRLLQLVLRRPSSRDLYDATRALRFAISSSSTDVVTDAFANAT